MVHIYNGMNLYTLDFICRKTQKFIGVLSVAFLPTKMYNSRIYLSEKVPLPHTCRTNYYFCLIYFYRIDIQSSTSAITMAFIAFSCVQNAKYGLANALLSERLRFRYCSRNLQRLILVLYGIFLVHILKVHTCKIIL